MAGWAATRDTWWRTLESGQGCAEAVLSQPRPPETASFPDELARRRGGVLAIQVKAPPSRRVYRCCSSKTAADDVSRRETGRKRSGFPPVRGKKKTYAATPVERTSAQEEARALNRTPIISVERQCFKRVRNGNHRCSSVRGFQRERESDR